MRLTPILATGALLVFGAPAGALAAATLDLVGPIAEYKLFVAEKTGELVTDTEAFVAAIKGGDLEKAKSITFWEVK